MYLYIIINHLVIKHENGKIHDSSLQSGYTYGVYGKYYGTRQIGGSSTATFDYHRVYHLFLGDFGCGTHPPRGRTAMVRLISVILSLARKFDQQNWGDTLRTRKIASRNRTYSNQKSTMNTWLSHEKASDILRSVWRFPSRVWVTGNKQIWDLTRAPWGPQADAQRSSHRTWQQSE